MEVMERVRTVVASFVATILLSLPLVVSSATTCVGMPPLKPIHRICGVVFFPSGDRVHNAKVTVLQGGKEIAVQETRDEGKFSFEHVKAGNYEIQVRVNGVPGESHSYRPSHVQRKTCLRPVFLARQIPCPLVRP